MSHANFRTAVAMRSHSVNDAGLSDDQLRQIVPSAFAADRHESRSERYTYLPTHEIIAGLRDNGFIPVFARQGTSRIEGKAEYTKHCIRLRLAEQDVTARKIGGLIPEVVLVNSHDGTSAYKLMSGLLRMVCTNGMVCADKSLADITIPHKGDIVSQVIEGSFTVIEDASEAVRIADNWSGINLSRDEQQIFAESAHVLRFADVDGEVTTPVRPDQLLTARRRDDVGDNLWNVTSRVQENVIRGGINAMGRDANNRQRLTRTREVKGIDADVKLNRGLWQLATRMAELKAAA